MEKFEDLNGKILINIENNNNEELIFTLDTGEKYKLFHQPDCCECVTIEDIDGDFGDLINAPILMAEEVSSNNTNPDGITEKFIKFQEESFTWTFYKLATIKGSVTIRWYGSSNGYYSESVDWIRLKS